MKKILIILLVAGFCVAGYGQDKDLKAYTSEAQALQEEGKLQEAVDLLKNAVAAYPEESNAYLQLGLAWGALGQHSGTAGDFEMAMTAVNEGFTAFEKAIALDGMNYGAHFYYGVYGVSVPPLFGKLDSGVEHLKKAIEIAKGQSDTSKEKLAILHRYLAQGYQMQKKFEAAEKAWKEVLSLQPEGELADAAKVGLKRTAEEKTKAEAKTSAPEKKEGNPHIIALKKKINASPDNFDLLMQLGQAYFDEQRWIEAADVFKKATQMKSDDAKAIFMAAQSIGMDAESGYDERIYDNTDLRTNQAFEATRYLEKAYELDPSNPDIKFTYAVMCVQMPFFVNRIDEGLALLTEMAEDKNLSDDLRIEALYHLGFGYRKKGNAVWMKLLKDFPKADQIQSVYDEYGLREQRDKVVSEKGKRVLVTFHLGFMDELPPQTAVWVEDGDGLFVKTLFVTGFSGYAKERQINLPKWSKSSKFETDGTTGASIDWGKHTYVWDLTDHNGKKVKDGTYKMRVETAWWPSMQYGRAEAEIHVGSSPDETTVENAPHIPMLHVKYVQ